MGSSPSCTSRLVKSMELRLIRAGVPVLNRRSGDPCLLQALREQGRRTLVVRAGLIGHITHIDPPLQIGAGGQNHLFGTEDCPQRCDDAGHFPSFR